MSCLLNERDGNRMPTADIPGLRAARNSHPHDRLPVASPGSPPATSRFLSRQPFEAVEDQGEAEFEVVAGANLEGSIVGKAIDAMRLVS
jgi:hypothetical protein